MEPPNTYNGLNDKTGHRFEGGDKKEMLKKRGIRRKMGNSER